MTSDVLQDNNIFLKPTVVHSNVLSGESSLTDTLHRNHWRIWRATSSRWEKE